jgi:hypothetical protein
MLPIHTAKRSITETAMRPIPLVLSVLTLASGLNAAEGQGPAAVPSYQQALETFQAEQARTGGPKLTAEDRAMMERAARDLATAMPAPGLKVGEPAPDFELPNAFGQPVRLTELLAQGPVVLTFYRGAGAPTAISSSTDCIRPCP